MKPQTKLNILQRLIVWALNQYKSVYTSIHGGDQRCPNCKTWGAVASALDKPHKWTGTTPAKLTCGICNHSTYWNFELAPIAIPCDEFGVPLPDEPKPAHSP